MGSVPQKKPKIAPEDLWQEFVVFVSMPHLQGAKVPICGLCGNSGVIDTRGSAKTAQGLAAGIRAHCICRNGRAMKIANDPVD